MTQPLDIGVTPSMPLREARRLRSVNLMIWVGVVTPLIWCLPGWVYGHAIMVGYNLVASLFFVAALAVPVRYRVWLSILGGTAFIAGHQWIVLGGNMANHVWFVPMVALPFLIFPGTHRRAVLAMASVELALFCAGQLGVTFMAPLDPLPSEAERVATIFNTITAAGVLVLSASYFARQVARAERELETALGQSDRLLLNVLPARVAERLKAGETELADHYDQATILFADLVGFTTLARSMPAPELIKILSRLFSKYDTLTADLGLEKIKTIGDAYMVAAGVPEPRSDHADASAELALRLREATRQLAGEMSLDLSVRIGLHSGDVVAGVIGQAKFAFDLWGDTVNIASRMEHHGEAGCIQITAATQDLLSDRFNCERRGVLAVKGGGDHETYWLEGAPSESSD